MTRVDADLPKVCPSQIRTRNGWRIQDWRSLQDEPFIIMIGVK